MRPLILLAPAVLLAACGQPAPQPAPTANASPSASGFVARVKALDPPLLNGVLFRAISDAQEPSCQQVKSATETETTDGRPAWVAACQDGGRFTVVLSDDGTARVTRAMAPPSGRR